MRALLISTIAPFLLASAVSAAEVSEKALVEKGALTYGVAATFAPFEFQKDGALTGFDIEMIGLLAKKLKLATKPMNMEFKGLIPALQGSRIDLINSAMYIKPERAEQVDFIPYLKIGNQVIVAAGNPAKITGRDDSLCGKKIAVTLGAIEEVYAREDDKRCTSAGKPAVQILTLPTAQDSALSLRQGRADAAFDSTPGAVELMDKVPGVYQTVGAEFESNTKIGMAVRKGDTAMKAAIEAALGEIVADGSYKQLIAKWRLPESVAILP